MQEQKGILREQYELVRQARQVLFEYCSTVAETDFMAENSTFGRGSIANLLVHNANTYKFWLGKHALKRNVEFVPDGAIKDMEGIVSLFDEVDMIVLDFLNALEQGRFEEIECDLDGKLCKIEPMTLFTHVMTHEFHHKGQILSLSRSLGYTPVDTDIVR